MGQKSIFFALTCAFAVACSPSINNSPPPNDLGVTDAAAVDAGPAADGGGAPVDAGNGHVACTDDGACAASGQRCYRPLGYCVQCTGDTECSGGAQVCTQGRCVARVSCTTSRECPGQVCDLARGVCADCATDPDCPGGSVCRLNNCVAPPAPCRSDRECGVLNQVCDAAHSVCVDCLADRDCPAGNYCTAASTCVPQACTPNVTECLDMARSRVCDARGTRWSELPCAAGTTCSGNQCVSQTCAPGSRECVDATSRRACNADGLGYTVTACAAGEGCDRGDCLPRACTPGTAMCSDGVTRRVCNADGLGYSVSPCPAGQGCAGGTCVPFVCSPGAASCADVGTRRVCAEDGQSFANAPCPASQSCSAGSCTPWACTPGATMCSGASLATCNADGLAYSFASCSASQSCVGGACVARTCAPSSYYCDTMGARRVCSSDGTTSTPAPCDASQACASGLCRPRGDACNGVDLVPDGAATTVIPTGFSTSADVGTACGSNGVTGSWTDAVFHLALTSARDVQINVNTGLANTRVQLQSTCAAGQAAIGACLMGGNVTRRYRNLAAGDYYVVVEIYGTTGPIQVQATTQAPNTRLPGDACPGVDVTPDGASATIATAGFDAVSDVGTTCGSAASHDGYTDWVAHFTLTSTRDVLVSASPSSASSGARYELRSGCGAGSTVVGGCYTGYTFSRRYRALPPGDYYLVGEVASVSPGNVPVTVTTSSPDARPAGDACNTAPTVTTDGASVSVSGSGLDATSDVGTPCGSTRPRTDGWYDAVWRFTLGTARDVQLNFTNLPTSARWQVYQGCGNTPVGACNSTNTLSTFVRGLGVGEYFVVVESQYGFSSTSPTGLRIATVAPGARLTGDACANPTEVAVDGAATATSINGFDTTPDVGTTCSTTGAHTNYGDAIWHFRLSSPRDVTLTFAGAPSSFYWQLQRTCAASAGVVAGCLAATSASSRRYRDLPAGDYYVVGEWYGALTNSVTLSATSTATTARVAGDICSGAVAVTPDGAAASVSVDGLALGGDYSTRCGSGVAAPTSYRDAVFSYTTTTTRDVTVTVAYSGTAYFEVWSACGDSSTALLSCTATSAGTGRLLIPRQAAGTYFVVAQTTASTGPLAVSVATTDPSTTSGYTLGTSPADAVYVNACSSPGAVSVLPSVDDSSAVAPLPFNFRFWGTTMLAGSNVGISSNGFVSMDGVGNYATSGTIPSADSINGVIAANWIDLVTGTTGVCYATLGAAPSRRWVVQWANAVRYSDRTSPINMEIVLSETSNTIDLLYGATMTAGGTVGVENQNSTLAVSAPSTAAVANARLRFTPN